MYAIILAGGSGTRLWPISRELFPKQFMPLPRTGDREELGEEVSLIQATVIRVVKAVPAEKIIVVTHVDQAGEIRRQLDSVGMTAVRLLEEPEARNTAPAIGLAAGFLKDEAGSDAIMAVLPSDHLIPDSDSFRLLLKAGENAAKEYGMVTYGIQPTYPETGYGYILCGDKLMDDIYRVDKFVEKPNLQSAKAYLEDPRYLWNSGMFVFQVGSLVKHYEKLLPEMYKTLNSIDYKGLTNLESLYHEMEKTSIDYGILEKAESVTVIPTAIDWSDLGSWEAYHQIAARDENNNYQQGRVISIDSKDSLIISKSRLISAVGVQDLVIVDTEDSVLVCNRKKTQDVKKVVDRLKDENAAEAREHRTVYRPWGSYTSLELKDTYQVKRIDVNPGARLSLQSHKHRAENWVVVKGEALVTRDEEQIVVKKGESIFIPKGARHRMENQHEEPLTIIEVQNGDYLGEDDIVRYEDDYGRSGSEADPLDNIANNSEQNKGSADYHYTRWVSYPGLDPEMKQELEAMEGNQELIDNFFGREVAFGTGGMRGLLGPGLNRINCYTISRATQGLADYIKSLSTESNNGGRTTAYYTASSPASAPPDVDRASGLNRVAIAYDTRQQSLQLAEAAARVLAANGIKALLFNGVRPTPLLSYTTRELGCAAGIVITASHNPPDYNGFKIYGPDGGQAVSPLVDNVIEAIKKVDIFEDVKTVTHEEAVKLGLLEMIDPVIDQSYLEKVGSLSLSKPGSCLKVVFTPLHGTGTVHIPALLNSMECIELTVVEEQMVPDPKFRTVKVPNPEDPAALDMALDKARQVGADLVLATDPDGDRVGTAVRDSSGNYVILNGNQVGALLIEYLCSNLLKRNALPANPVLVKTIVTGDLGKKVAAVYGLQTIETLTGFKYIGEKIKEFKEKCNPNFVFGYEESCGFLTGTFVRDKDAAISSFLIAEMAAYYREQGEDLLQVLDQIQKHHGYHSEELFTVELKDISEADRYVNIYKELPNELAGLKIVEKRDYENGRTWNLNTGQEKVLTLPSSQVLHYTLEDGSWFAVRPSGTEPKVKFYMSVHADCAAEASLKLNKLRDAVLDQA